MQLLIAATCAALCVCDAALVCVMQVSRQLPYIYQPDGDVGGQSNGMSGGLVLSPAHLLATLRCSWHMDGGTVGITCNQE